MSQIKRITKQNGELRLENIQLHNNLSDAITMLAYMVYSTTESNETEITLEKLKEMPQGKLETKREEDKIILKLTID